MQIESKKYPYDDRYTVFIDGTIVGPKKKLKPAIYPQGYLYVRIQKKSKKIHQLVAITHIPNPNNYTDVNHINGIKSDNRVENLEWCNDSINIKHAFRTGLRTHFGDKNPRSKIKESELETIRTLIANGLQNKEIAKQYGVSHQTISAIRRGRNWKTNAIINQ